MLFGGEGVAVAIEVWAAVAVPVLTPYRNGAPVLLLAGEELAAFQQQHAFAGGAEGLEHRSASRARPDDDDVVVVLIVMVHCSLRVVDRLRQTMASGATHAPVAPRSRACDRTNMNSVTAAAAN